MRFSLLILILAAGGLLSTGCHSSKGPGKDMIPAEAREINVQRKLAQRQIALVEELLIGEPGVQVDGRRVRIRGSSGGPLWVIDGMYTNTPIGINPRDIDRMWILASGSGYGRRGAHGVVIIRTRVQ